jgi:hypothetical protein
LGSVREHIRVVACDPKRLPGKMDTHEAARLGVLGPAIDVKVVVAPRCQGQGGTVARIALDYSAKEVERNDDPFLLRRVTVGQGAQIQIVGSEVAGRPFNRASDFVCL